MSEVKLSENAEMFFQVRQLLKQHVAIHSCGECVRLMRLVDEKFEAWLYDGFAKGGPSDKANYDNNANKAGARGDPFNLQLTPSSSDKKNR